MRLEREKLIWVGKLMNLLSSNEHKDRFDFSVTYNDPIKEGSEESPLFNFDYILRMSGQESRKYIEIVNDPDEWQKMIFYKIYSGICHLKDDMETIIEENKEK